jgi:hypothetical protein
MNDLLTPPGERDLPPRRAMEMRAELITATRGPRPRPTRRWLVAAVSATAVVTAVAGVALTHQVRDDDGTQILAMGSGELNPGMKRAADQCLRWYARDFAHPGEAASTPGASAPASEATTAVPIPSEVVPPPPIAEVPVSKGDIAVATQQGDKTAILFLNEIGYLACDIIQESGPEITGGLATERWPHRDWLPGPVQRLSLTSTGSDDGGDVAALGRVSSRVHRLVLERGNGQATTARLSGGTFGLLTTTNDVRPNAELVSYDAAGEEIDRRPLFQGVKNLEHCYTDPAGTVIYGEPGPDCLPADPWKP